MGIILLFSIFLIALIVFITFIVLLVCSRKKKELRKVAWGILCTFIIVIVLILYVPYKVFDSIPQMSVKGNQLTVLNRGTGSMGSYVTYMYSDQGILDKVAEPHHSHMADEKSGYTFAGISAGELNLLVVEHDCGALAYADVYRVTVYDDLAIDASHIEKIDIDSEADVPEFIDYISKEYGFSKDGLTDVYLPDLVEVSKPEEKSYIDSMIDDFVGSIIPAINEEKGTEFFLSELNTDGDDWDTYSVGDRIDLDNDGEDELILNGPYGGMYLDFANEQVTVFAEGDGTVDVLSYVYYDDAYWIVKSDTTHVGRLMYSFTKYIGADMVADSFELCAEYWDQDEYDENSVFTYRGEAITMERYEQLYDEIFGQ